MSSHIALYAAVACFSTSDCEPGVEVTACGSRVDEDSGLPSGPEALHAVARSTMESTVIGRHPRTTGRRGWNKWVGQIASSAPPPRGRRQRPVERTNNIIQTSIRTKGSDTPAGGQESSPTADREVRHLSIAKKWNLSDWLNQSSRRSAALERCFGELPTRTVGTKQSQSSAMGTLQRSSKHLSVH